MTKHAWAAALVIATAAISIGGCASAAAPAPVASGSASPSVAGTPAAGPGRGLVTPAPIASRPAPAATNVLVCTLPVVSCAGQMRSEPTGITVSADGSGFVAGLTWTGWGTATATGTGTLNVNNCNPNCASGTFTGYPATVTLTSLTPYGSKQAYDSMTVSAPAAPYDQTFSHLVP